MTFFLGGWGGFDIGATLRTPREIQCLPYAGFVMFVCIVHNGLLAVIICAVKLPVMQSWCFLCPWPRYLCSATPDNIEFLIRSLEAKLPIFVVRSLVPNTAD